MQRDAIRDALSFLAEHGFTEGNSAAEARGAVRFVNSRLTIDASYNDRDGFDASVGFLRNPGTSVSIGTLMAALQTDERSRARSHRDQLVDQARWLERHLEKVVDAPPVVAEDCHALRFYHAGPWREEWGKAIVMDAGARGAEQLRLGRLRAYFGPIDHQGR